MVQPVPGPYAFLSFIISIISVLLIFYVTTLILRHERRKTRFSDVIRDRTWYPSLAIFQFLLWTFVITFSFIGVYLVRVFGGDFEPPPTIPYNLLSLMGISVTVPIASGVVSAIKYKPEISAQQRPDKLPSFATMLQESDKPTLTRFQMFSWTWIGIAIYLITLFAKVSSSLNDVTGLSLPDIDPVFVVLMGLSQVAYIGGKFVSTQAPQITEIMPKQANAGDSISIFGINFSDTKGTIWFNDKQVNVNDIIEWSDNKIVLKVPDVLIEGNEYNIRLEKGGSLTEISDKTKFKYSR